MKKLIFSMVAAVAFAALADDNYQALYWQVTEESLGSYSDAAYANLYATLDGSRVSVDESNLGASGFSILSDTLGQKISIDLSGWNGGALDGAMFFVELFNESGSFMAQSEGISYSTLLMNNIDMNVPGSGIPYVASGPAVFGSYAIPEPTSGLLMLLGFAGLALRRKRA